jgi:hypothetical protein
LGDQTSGSKANAPSEVRACCAERHELLSSALLQQWQLTYIKSLKFSTFSSFFYIYRCVMAQWQWLKFLGAGGNRNQAITDQLSPAETP